MYGACVESAKARPEERAGPSLPTIKQRRTKGCQSGNGAILKAEIYRSDLKTDHGSRAKGLVDLVTLEKAKPKARSGAVPYADIETCRTPL